MSSRGRSLQSRAHGFEPEGGICPTRNLSETEVLRLIRVSLGWVLSDNFRVGQFPASVSNKLGLRGDRCNASLAELHLPRHTGMVRAARQGKVEKWRGTRFRTASRVTGGKTRTGGTRRRDPNVEWEGLSAMGTREFDRGSIERRIVVWAVPQST